MTAKKALPEYYPPCIAYSNIYSDNRPRDPLIMHHTGNRNTMILQAVFRVSDACVVEVAAQVTDFTSFCAGSWMHSPCVVLRGNESFSTRLLPHDCTAVTKKEGVIKLVDVRDHGIKIRDTEDMRAYGYRVLANAIFSYGTYRGQRGLVASGQSDEGSAMHAFITQAKKLKYIRPAMRVESLTKGFSSQEVQKNPLRATGVIPIKVRVDNCSPFINTNSGNSVQWYPITLTNAPMGGPEGGNRYRDIDKRAAYWQDELPQDVLKKLGRGETSSLLQNQNVIAVLPTEKDSFELLTKDERVYLAHAGWYARQHSWCFG